jgi:hypothetical protein
MTQPDDPRRELLKQRAEAMASTQGWGLVAHACAIHRGHPHAEQMMADDIAGLESAGVVALVLAALGDELGDELGHAAAIDALRQRIGNGEHPARALASAMAEFIDHDGERALATQHDRQITAEFWAILDGGEPDSQA